LLGYQRYLENASPHNHCERLQSAAGGIFELFFQMAEANLKIRKFLRAAAECRPRLAKENFYFFFFFFFYPRRGLFLEKFFFPKKTPLSVAANEPDTQCLHPVLAATA